MMMADHDKPGLALLVLSVAALAIIWAPRFYRMRQL